MLIPFRTDRPRLRPAYLTITLIVVNTLIHFYQMTVPEVTIPVQIGGQIYGIEQSPLVLQHGLWGSHPTLAAIFSHMFLHADLFHLAGNMLFLWLFGSLIEDAIRPWGLAALYVGGGIAAAAAHISMTRAMGGNLNVPMIGASGAIAAVMGLSMLRFYKTRVQIFYWIYSVRGTFWAQSLWALLVWVGKEVLDGVLDPAGGVAHWAHVGGFAAGAVVAPFIGSVKAAKSEYFTDDPADNVEYLKRSEQVAGAERALRGEPNNAYLMRRLAAAQRHAGEYERAVETYQRCISSFASRNLLDQAADVYLELMEYNENAALPPEMRLQIARHMEQNRPKEAAVAYRLQLEQFPEHPTAELALLRLSALYIQKLSQPREGARYLDQFLQRYPNSQWAEGARREREKLEQQIGPSF
jgi:membrane associated rhomboid family serine protease